MTEDGIEVYVEIYPRLNRDAGWRLEVVDQEGGLTVWETSFQTDQRAHQMFLLALQLEGIRSFAEASHYKLRIEAQGQALLEP